MSLPTEAITAERLDRWKARLAEHHATPVMLIGVGHDHTLGQRVILVPENVSDADIRAMLLGCLKLLEGGN